MLRRRHLRLLEGFVSGAALLWMICTVVFSALALITWHEPVEREIIDLGERASEGLGQIHYGASPTYVTGRAGDGEIILREDGANGITVYRVAVPLQVERRRPDGSLRERGILSVTTTIEVNRSGNYAIAGFRYGAIAVKEF